VGSTVDREEGLDVEIVHRRRDELYVGARDAQACGFRACRPPLRQAILDPGYTPRARDLDALVDLLAEDELTKAAERSIGRLGPAAVEGLEKRFRGATPPLRARVLRAVGRFVDEPRARELLVGALRDEDPKSRRNAAMALGHVRDEAAESALLAAWEDDPRPEMRRTVAASLGKIGGKRSAAILELARKADDAELARIAGKASMMVTRTASRDGTSRVDDGARPDRPLDVVLHARRGLEEMLVEELATVQGVSGARVTGPGAARAWLEGPLRALFAARTMLGFELPLATEWRADGETLEQAVARAVTSETARSILGALSSGGVRYRLAWRDGAHRRAQTWKTAQAIGERAPALVNDPSAATWELVVTENRRFVDVALVPRVDDPRFTCRLGDVPAASHPTIAAALARLAGVRDDDVVWDAFVGSGSELVERAKLGAYASLRGTDTDARALEVARRNLDAAGVKDAMLEQADALSVRPKGVTLVITNPPMGRRVGRGRDLPETLDRFVAHVASVLSKGGRLVWVAPWGSRAREIAARAGLALDFARPVDMGGFDGELQRYVVR
jgi:predicted RNA methylase